ncbi:hypothetical protein Tco_0204132, partial [Tanacetum coccineum]
YTPATPHSDSESEPIEASEAQTTSPSVSLVPLSLDHPLTQTTPTTMLSGPLYYCSTIRMVTPSPSPPALPSRKRCWATSKLIEDTKDESSKSNTGGEESKDEGPDSEEEEEGRKDSADYDSTYTYCCQGNICNAARYWIVHRLGSRIKQDASFKGKLTVEVEFHRIDQGLGSTSGIRACALKNFDLEVMEFESAQSNTATAKLPILKLENGNSWVSIPQTTQENGGSVIKMSIPATTEEKTNKKNHVKARSLLLMSFPNEHQLTFSQYPDAKLMFVAIETRFGVVWMNKDDIETMSINDLYNNFNIVEKDVKKSVGASIGPQNMAFMTTPSTSSTNNEVSTASINVNTASPQTSSASLSDNVVYAFMVENPNGSNLLHQDLEQILEDDLEAMDLK